MKSDETTHFGYSEIPLSDKQRRVNDVFHSVASRYDLMNDLMSAGIHRLWKEALVTTLQVPPHAKVLDLAGGTGDVALRIHKAFPGAQIVVGDINEEMLNVGKMRVKDRNSATSISFKTADALNLPFEDESFDRVCMAFGIRNVPDIPKALTEIRRVLKWGGKFVCLEFSSVTSPVIESLYDVYSLNVIPLLGNLITKDRQSYQYLVESIRRFPPQEEFLSLFHAAGFKKFGYRNMTSGVVALHHGWRL